MVDPDKISSVRRSERTTRTVVFLGRYRQSSKISLKLVRSHPHFERSYLAGAAATGFALLLAENRRRIRLPFPAEFADADNELFLPCWVSGFAGTCIQENLADRQDVEHRESLRLKGAALPRRV